MVVGKFRLNVKFKEITSLFNSLVRLIGAVVGSNGPLSFFSPLNSFNALSVKKVFGN